MSSNLVTHGTNVSTPLAQIYKLSRLFSLIKTKFLFWPPNGKKEQQIIKVAQNRSQNYAM